MSALRDILARTLRRLCCAAIVATSLTAHADRMVSMGEGNDSVSFDYVVSRGLQVLDIDLVDGEWPDAEYVMAPAGAWGQSIINPTKVPGRMRIVMGDSVLYDTGEYEEDVSGMTLRLRGNSSAWYDKKPYKIKLQKKADLLLRTDSTTDYRDKNWILIRDETLHCMLGFELGRLVGMTWTPGYRFVNVVINNSYEGIYMLIENVRRNTDCRLDVSKNGYIFEQDAYWWKEPVWVPTTLSLYMKYTFKYPEEEDFTESDYIYMDSLVRRMELSYSRNSYTEVIDVPSWARWCLVHDIMSTYDFAGSNRFFTKYDKSDTTMVEMPVMWDFDHSDGSLTEWSRPHTAFYTSLFNNADRTFTKEYVSLWYKVRPTLYDQIHNLFTQTRISNYGQAISASLMLNNTRWGDNYFIYSSFIYRSLWVQRRMPWLDEQISQFFPPGDMNSDGVYDISDINILVNMVLGVIEPDMLIGDLKRDGVLDVSDVNELLLKVVHIQ